MNKRKCDHLDDLDYSFQTKLKTSHFKFEWEIIDFEMLIPSKTVITSEVYSSKDNGPFRWYFSLKLSTDEECGTSALTGRKTFLSVYMNSIDSNKSFVKLSFKCCILDNDGAKGYKMSLTDDSPTESQYYGFDKFISLDNLIHSKNIFLAKNSLKLAFEINLTHFVHALKNSEQTCGIGEHGGSRGFNKGTDLSILFKNPDFSDLTIICDDVRILVHKNILAAKSEVFYRKLKKLEGNELSLQIPFPVVQELLSFMYTGNCPNLEQYAYDLYTAAVGIKIPDLKDLIERTLSNTITLENALSRLIWAETENAQNLKTSAIDFIVQNFKDYILESAEYKTIVQHHPELMKELLKKIFAIVKDKAET